MGTKTRKTLDELNEDRAAIEAEIEARKRTGDAEEGGIHIHVHTTDKATAKTGAEEEEEEVAGEKAKTMDKAVDERFAKIEKAQEDQAGTLAEILKAVKEGKAATTDAATIVSDDEGSGAQGDSKALERSFGEFVSQAEILVPGFRTPTFDSASQRKATVDSMCAGRRAVLGAFYATKEGKAMVDSITGRSELSLDKASCADVAITFRASAAAKAAANNRAATGDSGSVPGKGKTAEPAEKKLPTLAEINAMNEKHWAEVAKRTAA